MAKFKVGDKVEIVKGPTPSIGDFGTVGVPVAGKADGMFGDAAGENLVSLIGPGGKHVVPESWLKLRNSRACNSKNPVVAKAMNACGAARNAGQGFDERFVQQKMQSVANDLEDLKDYIVRSLPDETVDPSSFRRLTSKYLSPIEAALRNL